MRGLEQKQTVILPMISVEALVAKKLPPDHPLWKIKKYTDSVLQALTPEFDKLYEAKLANLDAAIKCNHKRTPPKTFEQSLQKKEERLKELEHLSQIR